MHPYSTMCMSPFNIHCSFQWLTETFLPYLNEWEHTVYARQEFTWSAKNTMLLPPATLLGLRMSSKCLCFTTVCIKNVLMHLFFLLYPVVRSLVELFPCSLFLFHVLLVQFNPRTCKGKSSHCHPKLKD